MKNLTLASVFSIGLLSFACTSIPELSSFGDGGEDPNNKGGGSGQGTNNIEFGEEAGMGGDPGVPSSGGSTSSSGPLCGDGSLDDGEECDDGNGKPTDGCTGICTIESGYICETPGEACELNAECGNGDYEPIAGERCDDGGLEAGDGCDENCQVEAGWSCDVGGCEQTVIVVCGDGKIGPGEECEDGEPTPSSGDGCSDTCQVESGFECLLVGQPCEAIVSEYCGNGIVVDGEECDDGKTDPGDGCDARCQIEVGYACPDGKDCAIVCGDSLVVGFEACDDGDEVDGNGCEGDCRSMTEGYLCPTAAGVGGACVPSQPGAVCPNSKIEFGEECDDGNADDGDGCTACTVDDGYVCSGAGTPCELIPVCGDGFVDVAIGEECDDGVLNVSDGCSNSCQAEDGYICPAPVVSGDKLLGGACAAIICGDGAQQGIEECDDGDAGEPSEDRNDDGCLEDCTIEDGWVCPVNASCQAAECGDGILAGFEDCDNGADNDGATTVDGVICAVDCRVVADPSLCGNALLDPGEACDDGNNDLGDGCGIECKMEPTCTPPQACTTSCGDGIKFGPNEECDDGNTRDGDGCSSTCIEEEGFSCSEQAGGSINLPIVYRDFKYWENAGGHVAFQWSSGDPINHTPEDVIWVRTTLGTAADTLPDGSSLLGKPVFNWYVECGEFGCTPLSPGAGESQPVGTSNDPATCLGFEDGTPGTRNMSSWGRDVHFCGYGAQDFLTFSQWYRDDPINSTLRDILVLDETAPGSDTYVFEDTTFFPLNGRGFGNEGDSNNFSFTSEVRYWFEYDESADANLAFFGDDDVWVFVNGSLVVDISGTHGQVADSVTLNSATQDIDGQDLNLEDGKVYEIVVFQAERNKGASNYKLTLSGFSLATSTCVSNCGDGIKASDEQCDDGNTCDDLSTCTDGLCDDGSACNDNDAYNACTRGCILGAFCGDGVADAGSEDCDDGYNNALYSDSGADACASGCKWAGYCGDGETAVGFEQCDGGQDCEDDCTLTARCGDGIIDVGEGEVCDDGVNNGTLSSKCALNCVLKCGNGEGDAGEQCDPGLGGFSSEYGGCLPEIEGVQTGCVLGPHCGDGVHTAPEACDDGKNDGSYGTCGLACSLPPRCGDGEVQLIAGEQCDAGGLNVAFLYEASGAGKCTNACLPVRFCGDSAVTNGEKCDDGVNDGTPGSCQPDCSAWVPQTLCGTNEQVDPGEECDPSVPDIEAGYCDSHCRLSCGNGVPETAAPFNEECDDGVNDGRYGTCNPGCTLAPYCGDGAQNGPEECDRGDQNELEPYGAGKCTSTCKAAPYCGDGRIDINQGEACDGAPGCAGCQWIVVQ